MIINNYGFAKIVLFFVNPVLSLLESIKNPKGKYSYVIFYLFCFLFGWCFIAETEHFDSYRYVEEFNQFCLRPTENLKLYLNEYFSGDSYVKDIYVYVLYWIAAKIGGQNYHFYMLLSSIVFSFFSLRSMKYMTQSTNFDNSKVPMLLLFIFVFSNSIFNINGFRFWTAAWMIVYSIFRIVYDKKYFSIIWIIAAPLVHGSMVLVWPILLISWIAKNKQQYIAPLFVISFFFSEVALQNADYIKPYLPPYLQQLLWSYTEREKAVDRMNNTGEVAHALHYIVLMNLPQYITALMTFLLIKKRKLITNKRTAELLGFVIVFYTCINFISAIPSIGRFYKMITALIVFVWLDSLNVLTKYNKYWWIIPLAYLYPLKYYIHNLMDVTNYAFYLLPVPIQIILNI